MASVNQSAPHRLPDTQDETAPITLLYIRSTEETHELLDGALATIAARYAPMVELVPVAPADVDPAYAGWAERTPTVLVVRGGKVVGEAIGAFLPVRELDRVVRCAVDWA